MIRTIVIAAVLWILGGGALWALNRYTARLDGRAETQRAIAAESDIWEAGKGSASQAPGSPGPLPARTGDRHD